MVCDSWAQTAEDVASALVVPGPLGAGTCMSAGPGEAHRAGAQHQALELDPAAAHPFSNTLTPWIPDFHVCCFKLLNLG